MSSAMRHFVIFGCAAVILVQSASDASPVYNQIQIPIGSSNYTYTPGIGAHMVHTRTSNWNNARRLCMEYGGYLAIINSVAEAEVVAQLLNKSNANVGYIGVHDLYNEDEFVTIHGDSLAQTGYEVWNRGQPDNWKGNEHCLAVGPSGRLNDFHCSGRHHFICELQDPVHSEIEPKPDLVNPDAS